MRIVEYTPQHFDLRVVPFTMAVEICVMRNCGRYYASAPWCNCTCWYRAKTPWWARRIERMPFITVLKITAGFGTNYYSLELAREASSFCIG